MNRSNIPNDFQLDARLQASSFHLIDWPLSRVLLKNNADYPWLILVPRRQNVTELLEFCASDQMLLMQELHALSAVVQEQFKPDKINIGALGNIVPQFHMHVVARFQKDPMWPQGIWQDAVSEKPYVRTEVLIASLVDRLRGKFRNPIQE